jgi:hypothetical protein
MTQTRVKLADLARELLEGDGVRVDALSWLAERLSAPAPPDVDHWEEADKTLSRFVSEVDNELKRQAARGLTPRYRWLEGPSSRVLLGVAIEGDIEEERVARHRRSLVPLLQDLTPRQFEHCCVHLLDVYGADPAMRAVTPHSDDDGFDFYGIYRAEVGRGRNRIGGLTFRIAGQAKRYSGPIGGEPVEVFGARLRRWRMGAGDFGILPAWFREFAYPILGLFVTASRLRDGDARQAALENVILVLEGDQVAEDLAWSPRRTEWEDVDGQVDAARFRAAFERT